jgi:hypothetical protein
MKLPGLLRAVLYLVLLPAVPSPAAAWHVLVDGLDITCNERDPAMLACTYRSIDGRQVQTIDAEAAGTDLPIDDRQQYPWPGALTAILIAVDTSDPGRAPVVARNAQQIGRLLDVAGEHHLVGIAAFDSALRMKVPIGAPVSRLRSAASSLRAAGMTTELYRSLLDAVNALSRVAADRRALLVFSDGQPEDTAYFHEDVVRAALKGGVVIHSFGFPRSVARSVALQNLRRLSEETGGLYLDTGMDFELPSGFAESVIRALDAGGRFSVNLKPEFSAVTGAVLLTFATDRGQVGMSVPVEREAAAPSPPQTAVLPVPAGVEAALPAPARTVVAVQPESGGKLDTWLWYGMPVVLLALLILTLATMWLLFRRPATKQPAISGFPAPPKPLAYLVSQDEKAMRHPIMRTIWRIGRSRDNEMTLDDNSVSRRHAEIQRRADGTFILLDRNSLNGVFVNGERIGKQELKEGDVIEIGDVYLRFTESPASDQAVDITSVEHTRAPAH